MVFSFSIPPIVPIKTDEKERERENEKEKKNRHRDGKKNASYVWRARERHARVSHTAPRKSLSHSLSFFIAPDFGSSCAAFSGVGKSSPVLRILCKPSPSKKLNSPAYICITQDRHHVEVDWNVSQNLLFKQ